jgi:ribosomal protein S18 acetylase RimI-like enzyme
LGADVVTVRPFRLGDLDGAARFCEAARALDPVIEPFAQRLLLIANGSRARLSTWRVAEGEDRALYGISFVAERDPVTLDLQAAVHPRLRRRGLGRALCQGALALELRLRARVREDALPGRAFLRALGFAEGPAQLSLRWQPRPLPRPSGIEVRAALAADAKEIERLSREAWAGAPDALQSRPDELAQLFGDDRALWLALAAGRPAGYLAAVRLGQPRAARGTTLGIEEIAVLPEQRRRGIGKALLSRALAGAGGAVLSVAESNEPARALYQSFGFSLAARRLIYERPPKPL